MLSINQKKYINSLQQKKFRAQHGTFLVEGEKMVEELIQSNFEIEHVFVVKGVQVNGCEATEISEKEMKSISALSTPNNFLAVAKQKKQQVNLTETNLVLVLDNIKDPGNLGTIIRTADWFGINTIVCSNECVDVYNPKVVQATMGSIFRANVLYVNLVEFLQQNKSVPVYGALLEGENIYKKPIQNKKAFLLMGSESFGISKELTPFITNKIMIPKFGGAESLNVAVATGILCSAYRQTNL
jgi:TrmH family RNA methyltransferase